MSGSDSFSSSCNWVQNSRPVVLVPWPGLSHTSRAFSRAIIRSRSKRPNWFRSNLWMHCPDLLFAVVFPSQPFYSWLMLVQLLLNDRRRERENEGEKKTQFQKAEANLSHGCLSFLRSRRASAFDLCTRPLVPCPRQSKRTKACCVCVCVPILSVTKPSFLPSVCLLASVTR